MITYEEFRDDLRDYNGTRHELSPLNLIETFLNSRREKFLVEKEPPGIYLLDYAKEQYLEVNHRLAELASSTREEMLKGGLMLGLSKWDKQCYRLYNEIILPINLDYFFHLDPHVLEDMGFICHYHVTDKRGNLHYLKQQSFFIEANAIGRPVLTLGFVWDITNRFEGEHRRYEHIITSYRRNTPFDLFKANYDIDLPNLQLTEKEREVARYFADGYNAEQIAEQLCKSVHTINGQRQKIIDKTGANNITHAIAKVIRSRNIK
jgi:DNA-binding CsgD family transcriptional regulator